VEQGKREVRYGTEREIRETWAYMGNGSPGMKPMDGRELRLALKIPRVAIVLEVSYMYIYTSTTKGAGEKGNRRTGERELENSGSGVPGDMSAGCREAVLRQLLSVVTCGAAFVRRSGRPMLGVVIFELTGGAQQREGSGRGAEHRGSGGGTMTALRLMC
jgi:hypothetical protein